jgi:hypothetical protein
MKFQHNRIGVISTLLATLLDYIIINELAIGGPRFWGPPRTVPGTGTGRQGSSSKGKGSLGTILGLTREMVISRLNQVVARILFRLIRISGKNSAIGFRGSLARGTVGNPKKTYLWTAS